MYTRLNSTRLPTMVIKTENKYEIAKDKSCVLIKGEIVDGKLQVGPIATNRHAVHVYRNPALGQSFDIITPDDGLVELDTKITKAKMEGAEELKWHYKVMIVRIDLPPMFDF